VAGVVQFVDRIDAAPTVRLDLNSAASGLMVGVAGIDFSPPPVLRASAGTLLGDGERVPAWAYANRVLKVPVQVVSATATAAAVALQSLARELARPTNVLRVRLDGMSAYTFYRTLPAPDYTLAMLRLLAQANTLATLEIPAEPFGLGLPVVAVNGVTVNNDPSNPVALQASKLSAVDAGFEASIGGWLPADADQTVARSTAQAHSGGASMLVTSTNTNTSEARLSPYAGSSTSDHTCAGNTPHWISGWVRAVSTGRTMVAGVNWYTSADIFISSSEVTGVDVSGSWTQIFGGVVSPPTAGKYELKGQTLAPAAAEGHYWDDLTVQPGTPGNMLDVTGVTGDVETPAKILMSSGGANMAPVVSVRRHGTVTDISPVVQAEHMTQGTDTTVGTDATMANGQRSRCSFATNAAMATRLTTDLPYSGGLPRVAARGTYRLFAVVASSATTNTYALRYRVTSVFGGAIEMALGDTVTYVATGTGRQVAGLGLLQVPAGPDPVWDGYGAEASVGSVAVQIQAQRVSGTGSLDFDYVAALPADKEYLELATTYLDIVADGVQDAVYTPGGFGEVTGAAVPPIARAGTVPMLSPNQTNRLYLLRPDGLGTGWVRGADVRSRTATVTITYWPRTLTWFP
jgi:hypothetical protein